MGLLYTPGARSGIRHCLEIDENDSDNEIIHPKEEKNPRG